MANRSPVISWLLLAATLAVNAVPLYLSYTSPFGVFPLVAFGLTYGQVSLLCVWAACRWSSIGWAWLVPFAAGLGFALLWLNPMTSPYFGWEITFAYAGLFWIQAALALGMLWFLKPTRILQHGPDAALQPSWQFSIKNLLVITTGLAVLVTMLSRNDLWTSDFTAPIVIILGNVLLLLSALVVCATSWHWLMRLAAVFAAAIGIGIAVSFAAGVHDHWFMAVTNLIQALVLMAWLELSPILRRASPSDSEAVAPSPATAAQDPPE